MTKESFTLDDHDYCQRLVDRYLDGHRPESFDGLLVAAMMKAGGPQLVRIAPVFPVLSSIVYSARIDLEKKN
ncbi:hypothetical protein [Corynebacterium ulcerans]|uniref:hypothetical protein n=1 Tax=Corynebacterium ulcerans TaxID=65058 RepID=UPI000269D2F9|nr:hypothetical protein [Corynebacterium ulcerans]KPJ24955.1 hypothetical protein AOT31_02405 [Corynebacterium ulcerans]BAM26706.1 hypothetical protein CULC0102_0505 [Corynebacterium ulcerans 0102]BBJ71367.1 hypothetical protein CULC0211_05010 [Corynebacterium ulcerans]BBJ73674.1 hypothetical protein CULCFH20161_05010 [Corynebacterium ulcerans]BDV25246.1 hypothetical protein CULTSU28_04940 [Corynebacterium ulcerans]